MCIHYFFIKRKKLFGPPNTVQRVERIDDAKYLNLHNVKSFVKFVDYSVLEE